MQTKLRTGMKRGLSHSVAYLLALSLLSLMLVPTAAAQTWQLVWSDEFNGPAGSAPSGADWTFMLGKNPANGELEFYCPPGNNTAPCNANTPNIFEDGNGNLIIRAILTPSGTWTSGRMNTSGKHTFQFGRMEARMKLVPGAGFWPAFWMLGSNIGSVGWPTCGEQDIMEWVPQYTPTTTSSTIHGPGYSGANGIGSRFTFPTAAGLMMALFTPTESSGRKTKWSITGTIGRSLFSPLPQATSRQVHNGSLTIHSFFCSTSPSGVAFLALRMHRARVRQMYWWTMFASINLAPPASPSMLVDRQLLPLKPTQTSRVVRPPHMP